MYIGIYVYDGIIDKLELNDNFYELEREMIDYCIQNNFGHNHDCKIFTDRGNFAVWDYKEDYLDYIQYSESEE